MGLGMAARQGQKPENQNGLLAFWFSFCERTGFQPVLGRVASAACPRLEHCGPENSGLDCSVPLGNVSRASRTKQGDSLREIKIRDYTCGLILTAVGLGLYSYYLRELLAASTLISVAFLFLLFATIGGLLVWSASVQLALWARPASQNVLAVSRRLIAAYARP